MIRKWSPLLKSLVPYGEALLRLVYPAFCVLCRQALILEERALCNGCYGKLKLLELPKLKSCKISAGGVIKEYLCLYGYKDELKALWTQIKFKRRAWLMSVLKEPLQKFLLAVQPETRYDYLVPIPTTLRRKLERHYNQAELLASQISALSGIPVIWALKKVLSTPAQRQLSREDRQSNLRNSFAVHGTPGRLRGSSVLLVDDIFTTGATARECAQVIKRAGAEKIGIFTLAQTPKKIVARLEE